MVNTINKLTERNKELLTKIEELESKKSDFQELISKVREWTGEKEGGYYTSHDLAEYYLVDEDGNFHYGWRKEIVDKFDTLEYVKSLIRATKYLDKRYWKLHWEKIEEINTLKQEKETYFKTSTDYYKELVEKRIKIDDLEEELKEKEVLIRELEEQIELAKTEAECHLEALNKAEQWKFKQLAHKLISLNLVRNWEIEDNQKEKKRLENELWDSSEALRLNHQKLTEEENKNKELQKALGENLELVEKIHQKLVVEETKSQELERLLYLNTEPLPKRPSKFKLLKEKTKSNFKQFQQLVKKTKLQAQEFIARVEVKVK